MKKGKVFSYIKKLKSCLSLHKIAFVLVILFLVLFCRPLPSKIGVVDMGYVYSNAKVFKSIRDNQLMFENEWKENALAKKKELEQADKALSQKKSKMRKKQFDK